MAARDCWKTVTSPAISCGPDLGVAFAVPQPDHVTSSYRGLTFWSIKQVLGSTHMLRVCRIRNARKYPPQKVWILAHISLKFVVLALQPLRSGMFCRICADALKVRWNLVLLILTHIMHFPSRILFFYYFYFKNHFYTFLSIYCMEI